MIRAATSSDTIRIADIYNHYISNTFITFETECIDGREIDTRMAEVRTAGLPWLVAENSNGEIVGFAYATKWKGRCAYRFSVESTVYIDKDCHGQGWGGKLMSALFRELQAAGIHSVISGIALPNDASVGLHESFGMQQVAQFKQVGFKFEQWIDVGYWQKHL